MMDNGATCETLDQPFQLKGNHECEVLGRGLEAEESGYLWKKCKKNPGHEQFIPVRDFMEGHRVSSLSEEDREKLRTFIVRTVKIRVQWTSKDRPDEDAFSKLRGTDVTRLGTGFIEHISRPITDEPCDCLECDGKVVRKHWEIEVFTAHHVVCNTEEAKRTSFDLFYDDESCRQDGTMKTLRGVEVFWSDPGSDVCLVQCDTHDEALVRELKPRITFGAADLFKNEFFKIMEKLSFVEEPDLATLIVSHPHGQPKMITLGKKLNRGDTRDYCYDAATCPGSSGAAVFFLEGRTLPGFSKRTVYIKEKSPLRSNPISHFFSKPLMCVHSGAYPPSSTVPNQVNYSYFFGSNPFCR